MSPGSGGSAAWAGADALSAAGGDEDTVSENAGGTGGEEEQEEEGSLPAKRLEYPPAGVRAQVRFAGYSAA